MREGTVVNGDRGDGRRRAMDIGRRAFLIGAGAALVARPAIARPVAYPAPDRELMVPVEGGRIYVRVNGTGRGLPLLALHGGPGGTHSSLLDLLELADARTVILYDQLDGGRSDRPDDPALWRVGRFVDEIEAIRAALGIARWHVLGHSWGGTLALEYGARRPPALAGLVLASPLVSTARWMADANALRDTLPAKVRDDLLSCEGPSPPPQQACDDASALFYGAFNLRGPRPQAMTAYRHPDDRGFNAKLYGTMWGSSEFRSTGTLKDYDGAPLLARLDVPRTLFLVGQYDEARPQTIADFAARVPGSEYGVIPGAAHGTFIDRPDETLGLLRAWLARQDTLG